MSYEVDSLPLVSIKELRCLAHIRSVEENIRLFRNAIKLDSEETRDEIEKIASKQIKKHAINLYKVLHKK